MSPIMPNLLGLNQAPLANTNSISIDRKDKGLVQLCACYDFGGGVRLGDSFAIHSIAALPSGGKLHQHGSLSDAELAEAAAAVAELLPVCISLEDLGSGRFSSLPYPTHGLDPATRAKIHPLDNPPWFLVNAAASRSHCILGQNSTVDSLLMVLRRPWCVLEICCCDSQAVILVSKFATVAEKIYTGSYTLAIKLLSHEIEMRATGRPDRSGALDSTVNCPNSRLDGWMASRPTVALVRAFYTDLFFHGHHSRNPFWLCLIVDCAVFLNIAFSDLAGHLFEDAGFQLSLKCFERTMPFTLAPQRNANSVSKRVSMRMQDLKEVSFLRTTRLRRSASDSSLHNRARRQGGLNRNGLSYGPLNYHRLILLHRSILKRIGESFV